MALFRSSALQSISAHLHIAGERCPWCDQPIPPEKLAEISGRIAAREREHQAELTSRLKEQFAREKAEVEARAREDGKQGAEAAMQARLAELEQTNKAAEQRLRDLTAAQEAALNERLQEQRQALERAGNDALNAEKSKAFEDKLKLEAKLLELQRQLQNKTAEELGEGAEIDLLEQLKAEFVEDRIDPVGKGAAGADIIHDVFYNGKHCGRIIYEAKNRNAWRNDYVSKLRQDQLAAKADHAILSSQVFPAGARELHLQDGVIVTSPKRTLVLAQLLRRHVIQTHALRMSNDARAHKTAALYEFIVSERCRQLLDSVAAQTEDMLDLDAKEKKAHDATWKRRGELLRSVQKVHANLCSEIEQIIGTAGE